MRSPATTAPWRSRESAALSPQRPPAKEQSLPADMRAGSVPVSGATEITERERQAAASVQGPEVSFPFLVKSEWHGMPGPRFGLSRGRSNHRMNDEILTFDETATVLGIGRPALYGLQREGQIPGDGAGFRRSRVMAYIDAQDSVPDAYIAAEITEVTGQPSQEAPTAREFARVLLIHRSCGRIGSSYRTGQNTWTDSSPLRRSVRNHPGNPMPPLSIAFRRVQNDVRHRLNLQPNAAQRAGRTAG